MEIKKLKDVVDESGFKAILIGESGAGKTYSISTLGGNPLILSAEKGLLTLKDLVPDMDVVKLNSMADMRDAIISLRDDTDHDTIIIDSLSDVAEEVLAYEMTQNSHGMKAYGALADTMIKMVKAFRDLPKNVIFLCKQVDILDNEGNVTREARMPGKKVGPELPYLVDFVFYARSKRGEDGNIMRTWQTVDDEIRCGKQRGGKLADYEEPNWANIFDKVNS